MSEQIFDYDMTLRTYLAAADRPNISSQYAKLYGPEPLSRDDHAANLLRFIGIHADKKEMTFQLSVEVARTLDVPALAARSGTTIEARTEVGAGMRSDETLTFVRVRYGALTPDPPATRPPPPHTAAGFGDLGRALGGLAVTASKALEAAASDVADRLDEGVLEGELRGAASQLERGVGEASAFLGDQLGALASSESEVPVTRSGVTPLDADPPSANPPSTPPPSTPPPSTPPPSTPPPSTPPRSTPPRSTPPPNAPPPSAPPTSAHRPSEPAPSKPTPGKPASSAPPPAKPAPVARPARAGQDPRVPVALRAAGIPFTERDGGGFVISRKLGAHEVTVFIATQTSVLGRLEVRSVWSEAPRKNSPLSAELADRILQLGAGSQLGAWVVRAESDGGRQAAFLAKIPARLDSESLAAVIDHVASEAVKVR